MTSRLALALALVLATVAATPQYVTTFDAGRPDTTTPVPPAGAGVGHFAGGVSSWPPVYRANNRLVAGYTGDGGRVYYPSFTPLFPGTGKRAWLDLDSSRIPGDRWGTIPLVGTPNPVSVGAITLPILAPYGECLGGPVGSTSRHGQPCLAGGSASHQKCPGGWCRTPRAPVLAFQDSGSKTGCALYASQQCANNEKGVDFAGTCLEPVITYDVLYGAPQDTYVGRCGASRTMTDTVCGGVCATAADCLQGRPTVIDEHATQCINDSSGATCAGKVCVGGTNNGASCTVASQCPSGACGGCHCINECDEANSNEATCEERLFLSITRPPRQNYVVVLEQENGTGTATCRFAGGIFRSLCEGGSNAGGACSTNADCPSSGVCTADRMQVFSRGIETPQKIGVCTGGTELTDGGRNRTACATNADCACNTTWPTYNAGTCTAGTCTTTGSDPATPATVPSKVVVGWNDGQSRVMRIGLGGLKIEEGASPTLNWRTETTTVSDPTTDGSPSLTTSWTGGGGCSTAFQCLGGNGDLTVEPDDPFTSGSPTRLQHTTSGAATHEFTLGDIASTSDTPIAATLSVAAQDAETSADTAASVQPKLRRATGSTVDGVALDLAQFEAMLVCDGGSNNGGPCVVDSDCPGASNACKSADGNSTPARAYPVRPLTITKDPADGTTALSRTIVNGLIGAVVKGTPHGLSNEPRVTFATLETFLATVTPLEPNVLPGGKVVSFIGDSLTNDPLFFSAYTALAIEPVKVYDAASGGLALGNGLKDFSQLINGLSGSTMSTVSVIGSTGSKVDAAFVFLVANTLHPLAFQDPSAATEYGGLGQAGWCEHWTSGVGYGAQQGKPCRCPESSSWSPPNILAAGTCLAKNANFGSSSSCACTPGSTTECQLGGATPPGTITNATCTGAGACPNNFTGTSITSAAGTVEMLTPGCSNSPDCPGVCVATATIADMLDAKRRMEAMAAANGTKLVWVTMYPPPGTAPPSKGASWRYGAPAIAMWNAVLLAEQRATGGNWIDLGRYMLDECGEVLLEPGGISPCIKPDPGDGIHLKPPLGMAKYAELANACTSNTTLAGTPNRTTDGVCAIGQPGECVSSRCSSGLRRGETCAVDTDCSYCSEGARGKLGAPCTSDDQCARYRCVW